MTATPCGIICKRGCCLSGWVLSCLWNEGLDELRRCCDSSLRHGDCLDAQQFVCLEDTGRPFSRRRQKPHELSNKMEGTPGRRDYRGVFVEARDGSVTAPSDTPKGVD